MQMVYSFDMIFHIIFPMFSLSISIVFSSFFHQFHVSSNVSVSILNFRSIFGIFSMTFIGVAAGVFEYERRFKLDRLVPEFYSCHSQLPHRGTPD